MSKIIATDNRTGYSVERVLHALDGVRYYVRDARGERLDLRDYAYDGSAFPYTLSKDHALRWIKL